MTIPAMAPPDRPLWSLSAATVMAAPVGTGGMNPIVVVGSIVAVITNVPEVVGRTAGPARLLLDSAAAGLHWPFEKQYWSLAQQIEPQGDSLLAVSQFSADPVAIAPATYELPTLVTVARFVST